MISLEMRDLVHAVEKTKQLVDDLARPHRTYSTTHVDPPQSKALKPHDDAEWLKDGWSGKR